MRRLAERNHARIEPVDQGAEREQIELALRQDFETRSSHEWKDVFRNESDGDRSRKAAKRKADSNAARIGATTYAPRVKAEQRPASDRASSSRRFLNKSAKSELAIAAGQLIVWLRPGN